jgi:hypothetical protein
MPVIGIVLTPRDARPTKPADLRVTVVDFQPGMVQRMLVVRVELWPGGDLRLVHELGRVGIANASGLARVSDYVCVAVDDLGGAGESLVVRNHDRAAGFWPLLARALDFERAEAVPNGPVEVATPNASSRTSDRPAAAATRPRR